MTIRDPNNLKTFFENNDRPNQTNFNDLIESFIPQQTSAASPISVNAPITWTGDHTFSGSNTHSGVEAFSSTIKMSVTSSVAARGNSQGSAASVSNQISEIRAVTSASENGVILPGGYPGFVQFIINNTTASAKLYPPSGGTINALSSNAALDLHPLSNNIVQHITSARFFALRGS